MARLSWALIPLLIAVSCNDSSSPKENPSEDCLQPAECEPAFRIWSPEASAILLEKLAGPYAKDVSTLYLARPEMSEAQLDALHSWELRSEGKLSCLVRYQDVTYKATIFEGDGAQNVYFGTDSACADEGRDTRYVPLAFFQSFPGEIPYRPDLSGTYVIERLVLNQHLMKIDVRHSDGCGSFHNFHLMLDAKVSGAKPPVIQGYLRYRSDNTCDEAGSTHLEFDLRQSNFRGAGALQLKGWPKRLILPPEHG